MMYRVLYALQTLKDALDKPQYDGKITIDVNGQECVIKDVNRHSGDGMIELEIEASFKTVLSSMSYSGVYQSIIVPSDAMVKVYPRVQDYSSVVTTSGSTKTMTSDSWVLASDNKPDPESNETQAPLPFVLVALDLSEASMPELEHANEKIVTAYSEGRVVEFEQLNGAYYVIRFGEAHNRLTSKVR